MNSYLASALAAAAQAGIRAPHPLQQGQNLLLSGCWQGRQVVAKLRIRQMSLRLIKERNCLLLARELGCQAPRPLAYLEAGGFDLLLLPALPASHQPWRPADWRAAVAGLDRAPLPEGWGPLRADGRPRWQRPAQALAWYRRQLQAHAPAANELDRLLQASWPLRRPGLIHGDLHPGNRRGHLVIDWENVALADPLEEACRLSLASGWALPRCLQAWGQHRADPRSSGAWLRSLIESASYPGPRQVAASWHLQQWLALSS